MSKLRRRANGKPEFRSLDELLAEATQDDVMQRLSGKGRPIDLGGYMHADTGTRVANKLLKDNDVIPQQLQDRREAEMLQQQAETDTAAARQDLHPRRCQVEELQKRLRACWPVSVAPAEVFSGGDVPTWMTDPDAKSDNGGDWQELAAQLATSSAVHNRRRAVARRKVEESLTEVARLTRRLNEQVSLSRSIFPGIQMTPVRVEAHLERFDVDCPRVDNVPEDLARLLRQAVRAASPPLWRRLLA